MAHVSRPLRILFLAGVATAGIAAPAQAAPRIMCSTQSSIPAGALPAGAPMKKVASDLPINC